MIYDYSKIEKIYFVGDVHGEFSQFFNNIKNGMIKKISEEKEDIHPLIKEENSQVIENDKLDINDLLINKFRGKLNSKTNKIDYSNSVIVVAGDCGLGFNKHQYYIDTFKKINELMSINNTTLFFVRGNHDDPSYFNENKLKFSNIICVEDYSVIITRHHTTLCVGGAISVDRIWRKTQEIRLNKYSKNNNKRLYWDNEQVIYNENTLNEILSKGLKINSVVTHSSPSNMFPMEKNGIKSWFKVDKKLSKDIKEERDNLSKIYNFLLKNKQKIDFWVHGHFHQKNITKNSDDVICIALNDDFELNDINKLMSDNTETLTSINFDFTL